MDSELEETAEQNNFIPESIQQDCLQKRVCEVFELPDLERLTACILYHTVTRCINFSDTALVKAGYGITLRYQNENGETRSVTREGAALFFGLPTGFCGRNYTVYLPNPADTEVCDSIVKIEFCAILCVDED